MKPTANATFLHERAAGLTISKAPDAAQFSAWESCVCMHGSRDKFDLRLSLDGLDRERAASFTGDQAWRDGAALPDWAAAFEEIPALFPWDTALSGQDEMYRRTEKHIGKDNVSRAMLPFLHYGMRFLAVPPGLGSCALLDLQASLLCEITRLCYHTFCEEWRQWLARNNPAALFAHQYSGALSSRDFTGYTNYLYNGGWSGILLEYPVLTRQIYMLCVQWSENAAFMLNCLEENRGALAQKGLLAEDAGKISRLAMHTGDRHNNGRSVAVMEFENSQKLVYKPRSLLADTAWRLFLDWLKKSGYEHSLNTPEIFTGEGFGFAAFVENTPLDSEDGFDRYYTRMGELAALLYIFGSNDFHSENIIAWGEYPVPVDIETLLLHKVRPFTEDEGSGNTADAMDILKDSVLRTGLFPHWIKDDPPKDGWRNIGALYDKREDLGNLPRYNGEARSVELRNEVSSIQYENDFCQGFTRLYKHLASLKDLLTSNKSPLHLFDNAKFRFLTRQTQIYADVLRHMASPSCLKDGLDYSMQAERLSPAFLFSAEGETLQNVWELYKGEYRSLMRMDIPVFFADANSHLVQSSPDSPAVNYFMETAIQNAKNYCSRLSDSDLKTQLELINAAFALVRTKEHSNAAAVSMPHDARIMSADEMIDEAIQIYKVIMESAVGGEKPSWIVAVSDSSGNTQLGIMPGALYDGRTGLCVFLAALYRITGDERIKQDVHRIIGDFPEALNSEKARLQSPFSLTKMPLGYGSGIGGLIRALQLVSKYLGDRLYVECAASLPLTQEMIEEDKGFDVIGGAAGLSIAAYHLHKAGCGGHAGGNKYANALTWIAQHILKKQSSNGGWDINGLSMLSGLGHGAAGLALALLRGYEVSGNNDFLQAALKGIAFENTMYDEAAHNWRDMRGKENFSFMQGWCSGAPGIGLARLAALNILDNAESKASIRKDIENAVTQVKQPFHGSDHYCCGQSGRADFLLEASAKLNRPDLPEEARLIMSRVVARSRNSGGYLFNSQKIGVNPSAAMFQGLAGVGYALLRCVTEELESVLV